MLKSVRIWTTIALCIAVWLPLLAIMRALDRDPVRYLSGMRLRRPGVLLTRVNPLWQLRISGAQITHPYRPYVCPASSFAARYQ